MIHEVRNENYDFVMRDRDFVLFSDFVNKSKSYCNLRYCFTDPKKLRCEYSQGVRE